MSSIAGAELNQAQTLVSISTTVLKKSFESDQNLRLRSKNRRKGSACGRDGQGPSTLRPKSLGFM